MQHLNGHQLCAVDIKVTGTNPHRHDIYELCIIPLNQELNVDDRYLIFTTAIKPDRPHNIDLLENRRLADPYEMGCECVVKNQSDLREATIHGLDTFVVQDLLIDWFDNLKLKDHKKIMPVAVDWRFQSIFLINWLGLETFNMIFHYMYRDLLSSSLTENDIADYFGVPIPYAKNNFQYLCSTTNSPRRRRTALDDARLVMEVYKKMVRRSIARC